MSESVSLIRALLQEMCPDDDSARHVLQTALEQEVDPLLHCAIAFSISQTVLMERAADWLRCAFYEKVPTGITAHHTPTRLEALASVRLFGMRLFDRDIAFAAPDFFGLLRLGRRLQSAPELRRSICLLPEPALREFLTRSASDALIQSARQGLARRWPHATAHLELTRMARFGFVAAIGVLLCMILLAPYVAEAWLLPVSLFLLVGPASMRIAAVITAPRRDRPPDRPPDEELPIYSVLIPLRNEAAMVPQLFDAIWALDYPAARLDVIFVVEAASETTCEAVRSRLGDPRVSLVQVPDTQPRTKPKALDFAMPLCRGEFVVVYDAEDRPDPDQLWKAAARFRDEPELVCLQAHLVIDNADRSWLAALFAGEYSALFSVMLPALARWRLPIPLGGTSNHFRIDALRKLGGWDAYNVTEDADLGVRLARRRLRVDMLDSVTREYAPTRIEFWHGQRTRWMKGWMQTFIVHNRNPLQLVREMGLGPTLAFQVLALGMILAPLLHSGLFLTAISQVLRGQMVFAGMGWGGVYAFIMMLGYGSALAMTMTGLVRTRRLKLLLQQLLLPLYWLLMAFATLRALMELTLRPFHWFKTPHVPIAGEQPAPRRYLSKIARRWPAASK